MTVKEAKKIEGELGHKAVSEKLDRCDFDIYEWLSEEDSDKYEKARIRIYGE